VPQETRCFHHGPGRSRATVVRQLSKFTRIETVDICDNPLVADTKLPHWNSGSLLSCEAVGRGTIRYFFNDLPEGLRQAMCAHLAHCIRCRRKLDAFTTAWAAEGQRRKRTGDS
jgi:hypothetical protein